MNFDSILKDKISWKKITAENLDADYASQFLPRNVADALFKLLQKDVEYFSGDLAQVRIFGKWHSIPRQQVAYGDEGLKYTFSGKTVPALQWPPVLLELRDLLTRVTGHEFNFVLINRYRNGQDHIGEHRDDEKDLDRASPIASLSLGQTRDFVFKHADARRSGDQKRDIPLVKLLLSHGSLMMMNPPTNKYWYHSLPPRKSCPGVRLNLTFRKMLPRTKSHHS